MTDAVAMHLSFPQETGPTLCSGDYVSADFARRLEIKNAILREALLQYADGENWRLYASPIPMWLHDETGTAIANAALHKTREDTK